MILPNPKLNAVKGHTPLFTITTTVGARGSEKILARLGFSNYIIQKVKLLIDNHMFYYNPDEVGESSGRRLIQKVGLENMKDL